MSFSRKTNCNECGHPLHLQDLETSTWVDDNELFVFVCSACGSKNTRKSRLFRNGHINRSYLGIIKEDKEYLLPDQLAKISKHLDGCEQCRNKFNEEYLYEIEQKIKFNDKSHSYFKKNSKEVLKEFKDGSIKFLNDCIVFHYKAVYKIDPDDEFFRKTEFDRQSVCYYLRENGCLLGMVSFIIVQEKTVLDRIWFRSPEKIKMEQKLFQQLKEGKIKIKLETIKKIFKTLNND